MLVLKSSVFHGNCAVNLILAKKVSPPSDFTPCEHLFQKETWNSLEEHNICLSAHPTESGFNQVTPCKTSIPPKLLWIKSNQIKKFYPNLPLVCENPNQYLQEEHPPPSFPCLCWQVVPRVMIVGRFHLLLWQSLEGCKNNNRNHWWLYFFGLCVGCIKRDGWTFVCGLRMKREQNIDWVRDVDVGSI